MARIIVVPVGDGTSAFVYIAIGIGALVALVCIVGCCMAICGVELDEDKKKREEAEAAAAAAAEAQAQGNSVEHPQGAQQTVYYAMNLETNVPVYYVVNQETGQPVYYVLQQQDNASVTTAPATTTNVQASNNVV
jgi:hypothetical protein